MQAKDIMQHHVITTGTDTSAHQVALQLVIGRFSGIPVTEGNRSLIGIVTEFDLIRGLRERKDLEETVVDDLMTKKVIDVDAEASIEDVMEILEENRIIRVPVASGGALVGIVSRGDVLKVAIGSNMDLAEREVAWRRAFRT
jgi:CBS domain-containing protein